MALWLRLLNFRMYLIYREFPKAGNPAIKPYNHQTIIALLIE
jgi:hypothetical protein